MLYLRLARACTNIENKVRLFAFFESRVYRAVAGDVVADFNKF